MESERYPILKNYDTCPSSSAETRDPAHRPKAPSPLSSAIPPSNLTPNFLRKSLEPLALSGMLPSCLDEPYNPALRTLTTSLPTHFPSNFCSSFPTSPSMLRDSTGGIGTGCSHTAREPQLFRTDDRVPGGTRTMAFVSHSTRFFLALESQAVNQSRGGRCHLKENHAPLIVYVLETDFRPQPFPTTNWFIIRSLVERKKTGIGRELEETICAWTFPRWEKDSCDTSNQ